MTNLGRPKIKEEHYKQWLYDMTPYLLAGHSLDAAIKKANLIQHRTSIYEKYAQNDWFSNKIDTFQQSLGEIVNDIFVRILYRIYKKTKINEKLSSQEYRTLRFFAETHRSTIPYFVHKHEVLHVYADGQGNIEKVISNLMKEDTLKVKGNSIKNQINPSLSPADLSQALLDTLRSY